MARCSPRYATTDSANDLVNELDPVSYKYHEIGLQLGVTLEKLKEIDCLYTKSKDKLREVITERLKQAQPLTWPSIVSILRADSIKENDLASRLENKYVQAPGKDASIHHISPSCTSVNPLSNVYVPSDHKTVTLPMQRQPLLFSEASETDRTVANQTVPMASMYTGSTSNPLSHQQLTGISTNPVSELNVFQALPSRSSPEDVINRHSSELTEVIGNDLPYFSSKFIERGFITRDAAGDIDKTMGIGNRQKGNQLLCLAMGNYHISRDKNSWFEKFVAIFSSESAYESLASSMITECTHSACPHVPVSIPSSSSMSRAPSFPLHMPPAYHLSSGGTCTQDNVPLLQPPVLSSWPVPFLPPQPPNYCVSYYGPYYPQPHTSGPPPHNLPQITEFQAPPPKRHCVQYDAKELVAQFKEYVKTLYRIKKVERDANILKLPTPSLEYINLAIIDRKSKGLKSEYDKITEAMVRHGNVDVIKEKKCPIDINKIAANLPVGDLEKVILVEGAPGVGKSTFAWEFCRRWESGEIAQQYDLVLLLRLRDAGISQAKTLKDLICHSSNDICEAVIKELESSLGDKVLIILEGFDELPDACRTRPSLFLELINGQLLPLATVMVTSRPWATRDLHKQYKHRMFQHIEVLGFTKKQIKSYTASSLSEEEASGLDEYLGKHHQIQLCMYIPLNCAILVFVYQECLSTGNTLPTTLTELYTTLALTLLFRHLCGTPKYEAVNRVENFTELPSEVYQQFSDLCKLAYSGISTSSDQVKIVFTEADLPPDFNNNNLGLMDSVYEFYVTQSSVSSHNFLHLTFQEYLAAVHISKMQPAERLEHFDRHNEGKLRVVLRFLAGLTNLKDVDKSKFTDLLIEPDESSETDIDFAISYQADWLYEAGRGDLIQAAFDDSETLNFVGDDSSDFSSLGYCIAESQCQWVLSVGREIREEDVEAMEEKINGRQATCGSIVGLRGRWNDEYCHNEGLSASLEVMNMIFTRLKSVFCLYEMAINLPAPCNEITWPDLSQLRILFLEISGSMNCKLAVLLNNLSLESFSIISEIGSLVFDDCCAIAYTIFRTTSLEQFTITMEDVDCRGLERITEALAANTSLGSLKMSMLSIDGTAESNLIKMFSTNMNLSRIFMEGCSFSVQGLYELAVLFKDKPDLKEKFIGEIKYNVYGDEDALFLREHRDMLELHNVNEIHSLTDDGARYIAGLLCHNFSDLCELNIDGSSITDVGAKHLADALHQNSTLTELFVFNSNIGDTGAEALADSLYHNSTLKLLCLSYNSIGDAGAVALAKALHHNSTLQSLSLYGNDGIGREGTHHLIEALTVNRSINGITLSKQNCEKFAIQSEHYDTVKDRITIS